MKDNVQLANALEAKLPELIWRINALAINLNVIRLPEGLFNHAYDKAPEEYVNEIKTELKTLKHQNNEIAANYLARRIAQKIDVLVKVCRLNEKKEKKTDAMTGFSIKAMSTRQQWLKELESEIGVLTEQHKALSAHFRQAKHQKDTNVQLNLQADLGQLERRLTLAKEAWSKATSNEYK
jgi:ribosomal protein S15P/S13E